MVGNIQGMPIAREQSDSRPAPAFDVFMSGTVFLDIIFTGLVGPPVLGTEILAEGMGSCPGGIANLATAASRLGLRTALGAAFSTDTYGDFCWQTLRDQEGIDLSASRRFLDWHSPVTVSLSYDRDRGMITHAHPAPVPIDELTDRRPSSLGAFAHLGSEPAPWIHKASDDGTLVFADVGWDPSDAWAGQVLADLAACHAFLPNSVEATRYTRTDDPRAALRRLADLVPVVVVTCGADGAVGVDQTTGEEADVAGLTVEALDPTGAGDVFGAGFLVGTLRGWPLAHRLEFANLCAALSVQHFGGSLSAPGWGDIADWWRAVRSRAAAPGASDAASALARRYAFLADVVPVDAAGAVRRATATIAVRSDVSGPDAR